MKKFLLLIAISLMTTIDVMAQSTMTDKQIMDFVTTEKEKGSSQSDIVRKLIERGVDIQQIQRIKRKYQRQINQAGLGTVADQAVENADKRMRENNAKKTERAEETSYRMKSTKVQIGNKTNNTKIDETSQEFLLMESELGGIMPIDSIALLEKMLEEQAKEKRKIFGHDIFNNEDLSFEPNMNIATPQDYRLGPGDAVIVDIYGASQETINSTVSPDGDITIQGFGPIQVSGLTVAQANARLRSMLGARYQSSQIKLTVGQTRTIMVNIMGEVNVPGTYTLSAFSTVFNAIYMAGGITDLGTLRNIKVYRNNHEISTVDVYDFILNGHARGNVRLADNDVIIVNPYECLVNLSGRVKRPMFYEKKQHFSVTWKSRNHTKLIWSTSGRKDSCWG
jgi:protein involved in polysaccharide export with SLBB domain